MNRPESDRYAGWALAAATILLLGAGLGSTDLWAPDEPRFAQIAEELRSLQNGPTGLVLLHANGEPYTQKPPLYYWLAAGLGSAAGRVTEVAARLPSAIAGVAGVAATVAFGRALFADPRAGLLAGAILLTVFRYAHLARRAQLDPLLACFELLALMAFWRIETGRGRRGMNLAALHGALGLALLTKGPVGLLPLAGMGAYLLWQGRGRALRSLLPAWSWGLSLLPVLLWLGAAVLLAPPGFFGEAVVENVFGRFFAGTSHARPLYYYGLQFPLDFLPWTLLWPLTAAVVAPRVRGGDAPPAPDQAGLRLLVAWIGVCLLFFSLSAGKRGLYLLPIFPAAALLCGYALAARLREGSGLRGVFVGAALTAAGLLAAGMWVGVNGGAPLPNNPGFFIPASFGWALAASCALALVVYAGLARVQAGPAARLPGWFAALVAVYGCVFWLAYPAFDPQKSPRPVAQAALARSGPEAPIGIFDQRALTLAIAYYSGRTVRHFMEPEEAVQFAAQPGRALIVRASRLSQLGPDDALQIHARLREGRRELLIVTARPGAAPDARSVVETP
jgi:4-amino-4-deoxy-L-arabinose transferase-like glycosyltransferase